MALEVVEVEGYKPEDFGYKSFSVEALKFFAVSVKIEKQGKSVFTTADGVLLQGADTVGIYKLGTAPKLIKFVGDVNVDYEFVVIKDGFARYNKHFNFKDLLTELNHKPLVVTLVPALTLRLKYQYSDFAEHHITFDLESQQPTNYIVNWGDGTVESLSTTIVDSLGYTSFDHFYPKDSDGYFISITGDLDKITSYNGAYNEYLLTQFNIDALSDLRVVDFSISGIPGDLDARQNSELEGLWLNCNGVLLPKQNKLNDIRIYSNAKKSLDYIIENVYRNAVVNGIYNGRIDFNNGPYEYDVDNPYGPIAIPSPINKIKLKALRDVYHWRVYPLPETF